MEQAIHQTEPVQKHIVRVGWIGDGHSGTLTCPDCGWTSGVIDAISADMEACKHRTWEHGDRCPNL